MVEGTQAADDWSAQTLRLASHSNYATGSLEQGKSVTVANVPVSDLHSGGSSASPTLTLASGLVMPPAVDGQAVDGAASSWNAVSHEAISPDDLIRGIKDTGIAIKVGETAPRLWLFDDGEGAFVPPASEPLTIVIDGGHKPASSLPTVEAAGLVATAAMVSSEPALARYAAAIGTQGHARACSNATKWPE